MPPSARDDRDTTDTTDNEDICAVLGRLLSAETIDVAEIAGFALDHAHHAARLPQLLRELSTPRAA